MAANIILIYAEYRNAEDRLKMIDCRLSPEDARLILTPHNAHLRHAQRHRYNTL